MEFAASHLQRAPGSPLFLSDSRIRSLGLGEADVLACIERAVAGQPRIAFQALKATVTDAAGSYFQALPAILPDEDIACVKWVSVIAGAGRRSGVGATVLLTSTIDGSLLAVLDATWITTVRTAAMSALAARRLAKPTSSRIGFVGRGVQATAHLRSLKLLFPTLDAVVAQGRSPGSVTVLGEEARRLGMSFRAATEPRDAVEGQDIVVSTVPAATLSRPFLDGRWLQPGSLAVMVDLGRSWRQDTLAGLDVVATDDRGQSDTLAAAGKLAPAGPYAYDLHDLVTGAPTWDARQRSAFVFGGIGVCDAAVAVTCYRAALAADRAQAQP